MRKTGSYLNAKLDRMKRQEAFDWVRDSFASNEQGSDSSRPFLSAARLDEDSNVVSDHSDSEESAEPASADGAPVNSYSPLPFGRDEVGHTSNQQKLQVGKSWFKGYFRYETVEEVKTLHREGEPLSAFILEDNSINVAIGRGRNETIEYVVLKYKKQTEFMQSCCGLHYFKFEDVGEQTESMDKKLLSNVKSFCILLPYIQPHHSFHTQYTIITSEWETFAKDGEIGTPAIDGDLFKDKIT